MTTLPRLAVKQLDFPQCRMRFAICTQPDRANFTSAMPGRGVRARCRARRGRKLPAADRRYRYHALPSPIMSPPSSPISPGSGLEWDDEPPMIQSQRLDDYAAALGSIG
jgi:hypothetical protein